MTDSYERDMRFLSEVDSVAYLINASTSFNDGGEFGLGTKTGISNQKLHLRCPMGMNDLMAPKYIVLRSGQVRILAPCIRYDLSSGESHNHRM